MADEQLKLLLEEAFHLHRSGYFDKAEQVYKSILDKDPNHAECLNLLGGLYYQQRRYTQALEYSKKAIEADYKNPIYRNAAGMSLMKLKRAYEATEYFRAALELKPDYETACENLAKAYKIIRDKDKSESGRASCRERVCVGV